MKPEEDPHETPQQKLDRRALDQVHEYFTYKGESPSASYIVSVARPNAVLAVAILFDNGTIGVQVIPMGMKNRKGLDKGDYKGDFDAFFVPRYIPTREDQKFYSKMDPNHPLDMTPRIMCSVSGYGNMYSCDSKEDFDSAMLHLYGLDLNKPSIPIR